MFLIFGRHANQCVLKDALGFSRESKGSTLWPWLYRLLDDSILVLSLIVLKSQRGWMAWECSSCIFFSPSGFWPNTGNSVIRWICASWWQVCEEPCPQQKEEALDFAWLCETDCQQSRRFDCNKQMIRDVRSLCHPLCDPCAWRLLSPGGWANRGCHFERWSCHIRGGWCFYTESLDVCNIWSSCKSMRFERCLGLFKRIQGKNCNTMTRSSQKFDMEYGIGHDVIVFLMLRHFSCHLVLKCIGNEDGWRWECPHRRVEHLSFFVFDVSIICYPWRVDHACFFFLSVLTKHGN